MTAARRRSGPLDQMPGRQPTDLALHAASSRALVYLIHGVTGTPAEMRYPACGLERRGLDVYATTLPGHCRRLRDLVRTTERDWQDHVARQLDFARSRYDQLFIAGLSAGGLLALDAATRMDINGIGVLSPTLVYDGWNTPWSNTILPLAMKWVPPSLQPLLFHIDGPPFGIKDPILQSQVRAAYRPTAVLKEWMNIWWPGGRLGGDAASSASKGNPLFPLKILTEIHHLITRVRASMPRVTAPTIILQAREDDMTSPRNAQLVCDAIGSPVKQLVLLDDCYHVITVDKQKKAVFRHLGEFFEAQISAKNLSVALDSPFF